MSKINLASNFSLPAVDYAGQGNAILGIRDAGKTYTAMKAAEELLDNKIPIIVYDPVGVWKNLKIGTGKHKGYPIVVAGGEGSDIRLTENNAVDIVRAAMKENVSLVIDLYSPELINKSKWIRIVQETVDLLMYENKSCGLRHIFIEEAAEFIPQRLQPQHSKVYASLERLARMGRNARLGYTLINQRAEEVNKAILEISAMSLLHKQVGKNSLKSIQQWMELLQVDNVKDIVQSLPGLSQGECWVIGMNTKPHKIKVSPRKTFHPDPKKAGNDTQVSKMKIDVSDFVGKLNQQLKVTEVELKNVKDLQAENKRLKAELAKSAKPGNSSLSEKDTAKIKQLEDQVKESSDRIAALRKALDTYEKRSGDIASVLDQLSEKLTDSHTAPERKVSLKNIRELKGIETSVQKNGTNFLKTDTNFLKPVKVAQVQSDGTLPIGELKVLTACAQYPNGLRRDQLTVITGYKRSSRDAYIQRAKEKGLLVQNGDRILPSEAGIEKLGSNFTPLPTGEDLQNYWLSNLPQGEAAILQMLIDAYPDSVSRDELSQKTGYQRSSRDAYIQRMASKEIVVAVGRGEVKASETLFN